MTTDYVDLTPTWTDILTRIVPCFLEQTRGSMPYQEGMKLLQQAGEICDYTAELMKAEGRDV